MAEIIEFYLSERFRTKPKELIQEPESSFHSLTHACEASVPVLIKYASSALPMLNIAI
jgi:hypothetical protein